MKIKYCIKDKRKGRKRCHECGKFPKSIFMAYFNWNDSLFLCKRCLVELRRQLDPLRILITTGEATHEREMSQL